ncbi:ABC transporter ATP-binding protein [Butyricimonas synergistica]|uniref:ABC transporter ATP-binding protein n=1 Tax=Butyricimonas synergistica TaxID=544644 RepID=UPI00037E4F06|nr:ABC transporter ATP-binding protein [Butyricimonas synergistica]
MPIIETINLYKTYKDQTSEVHAVDNVNISIAEGEFTAIVGPSGSGKTTLLNLIGGLDTPTSGNLFIDGQDISRLKPKEMVDFRLHHIGFVFQSFNLIPVLSAKENVAFVMELQGRKKGERDTRAQELLEAVGLGDRANSRPSKLSGGQQQRVAVARALASKPKFILADEPTANLDSKSAENLLDMMEKLNQKENITFVFSTHDPRIMSKARRIITLEDGKIINDIVK